ncbi:hypothetical protein [Streptomyces sp. NPDC059003]|uniref:hypothetical protein n=1 Tax=Streptomyces sp. NPDC059003 TaxID=3346691 RepID=UPI00367EDB8F
MTGTPSLTGEDVDAVLARAARALEAPRLLEGQRLTECVNRLVADLTWLTSSDLAESPKLDVQRRLVAAHKVLNQFHQIGTSGFDMGAYAERIAWWTRYLACTYHLQHDEAFR